MADSRKRNPDGTFQKGQPPPVAAHRQRGMQNKITRDIKEGAIAGFARHGSNGRGEGGFAGFCYYLAKKHPKAAAKIVEKLLPMQINGSDLGNSTIGSVNVISVPADHFLSAADIERLRPELPAIEHIPQEIEAIEVEHAAEFEPIEKPIEPEDDGGVYVVRSASLAKRRRTM